MVVDYLSSQPNRLDIRCLPKGARSPPVAPPLGLPANRLQEEHAGVFYQTVDETKKNLTEGGYGFVRGEVDCGSSKSGHDYRIDGEIQAGGHPGYGVSKELHLPCDV